MKITETMLRHQRLPRDNLSRCLFLTLGEVERCRAGMSGLVSGYREISSPSQLAYNSSVANDVPPANLVEWRDIHNQHKGVCLYEMTQRSDAVYGADPELMPCRGANTPKVE